MKKLQCPKCKTAVAISRIEAVVVYANIRVKGKSYEYTGDADVDWNSQSRELLDGATLPSKEFYCHMCSFNFDWNPKGVTNGKKV
jgi:hypothetical protein